MRYRLAAAACLAAVSLAMPAAAADPPFTGLPLTASGQVYTEATYSDGSRFFFDMMAGGWTGSSWKPWTVDANSYGGVNVFSSALPSGASTSSGQALQLTATQAPASIATGQGSVTTTAVQLVAARTGRRTVTVENTGTTPVYLGGSGVTSTTGFLLPGVAGASLTISFSGALYAVSTGTAAVIFYKNY